MNLFDEAWKLAEAKAVMHGIPIFRQFTDAELAPYIANIKQAEIDLAYADDKRHDENYAARQDLKAERAAIDAKWQEP